jgi:hypothetical protein
MGQPEKIIENAILDFLKAKRLFCFKVQRTGVWDGKAMAFRRNRNPHHIKGISDVLGITKCGTFFAIEVKTLTPKGYPSKEQKEFIANIDTNHGIAFVARSIDDVIEGFAKHGINL